MIPGLEFSLWRYVRGLLQAGDKLDGNGRKSVTISQGLQLRSLRHLFVGFKIRQWTRKLERNATVKRLG